MLYVLTLYLFSYFLLYINHFDFILHSMKLIPGCINFFVVRRGFSSGGDARMKFFIQNSKNYKLRNCMQLGDTTENKKMYAPV